MVTMRCRPVVVRYDVASPGWHGAPINIVVLSDFHVVRPWTSLAAIAQVVARANALSPDLILLPGDFLADPKLLGQAASATQILSVLAGLSAPLGVFATQGNHDWADCAMARANGYTSTSVEAAFADGPIRLLRNAAWRVARPGGDVWIAGIDSQIGERSLNWPSPKHDLAAALADIPPGADRILMAHEPDIWLTESPDVPLTVSGHTHGGQITFGRWRPLTPSRYGGRLAHGLHSDGARRLVVSGGLGFTGVPLRIGVPPEITQVMLRGT